MASRDDILIASDAPKAGAPPIRAQIASFIPITIALLGVVAILVGGMPSGKSSLAARAGIDPTTTGSIAR